MIGRWGATAARLVTGLVAATVAKCTASAAAAAAVAGAAARSKLCDEILPTSNTYERNKEPATHHIRIHLAKRLSV